jgi:hypothetical protein
MNVSGKAIFETRCLRLSALLIAAVVGFAAPASGQRQPLAMLDQLESGRWELRPRDSRGSAEQICVQDGRRLIQLRHPSSVCQRLIVSDGPGEVIVQYTCRGRGYGRTHIRRETGRLVQIESQGIVDGLPFDFVAEGRRIGDCAI